MAKNAMQSAWENKRKEEERLRKLKTKKQQEAGTHAAKAEEQPEEELHPNPDSKENN